MITRPLNRYLNCIGGYLTAADATAAGVDLSAYPLDISTVEYTELVHRARKVTVSVSLTENGPGGSSTWLANGDFEMPTQAVQTTTYDGVTDALLTTTGNDTQPADELGILTAPRATLGVWQRNGIFGGAFQLFSMASGCLFVGDRVRLALNVQVIHDTTTQQGFRSDITPYSGDPSPVDFTAFGHSIPVYLYQRFADEGYSYTGSVSVEISEWWEHAAEDGSDAWWNADTGEPIGSNPLLLL